MSNREYDIVLWGATGFTGALVAEYIVEHHGLANLRLALGGRDRSKLEAVRDSLARIDPAAATLPLLIGDSHDRPSLDAIAAATKVVCSTVGPYAKYGEELVAACAAHGTHYCDLTGEPQFIHRMIARHHAEAEASGARIVNCCGFDSVPSDLGVFMMHRAFAERGGRMESARLVVGKTRGGVSGGTIASMLTMGEELRRDPSLGRLLADPHALAPREASSGSSKPDLASMGVAKDRDLDKWTGPFLMAVINEKVVHRSNALLGYPYGRAFAYAERMSTGSGLAGSIAACMLAAGMKFGTPLLALSPVRKLAGRMLPKPGEGPDKATREAGLFVIHLIADGVDADGRPLQLRGRVEGDNDPGYAETAKMLGESALCLALDPLDAPGGLRTPASTMGDALLERLRAAGMIFRVNPST